MGSSLTRVLDVLGVEWKPVADTSAAVRCEYGNGRVFCFSPHPELTDGRHHLIPLVVTWLAARKQSVETP